MLYIRISFNISSIIPSVCENLSLFRRWESPLLYLNLQFIHCMACVFVKKSDYTEKLSNSEMGNLR